MLKVLYAGSPSVSAKVLGELLNNQEKLGFKIVAVLTNPPSAQGRHKELIPTELAKLAAEWNKNHNDSIKIFEPEHLLAAEREQIAALNADLLVCFAYGHIFGPKFLSVFPLGGINLHPSLLPKYRGATPVPAAILAGEKESGISIQKLALEADTGDILVQEKIILNGNETAESLLEDSAKLGAEQLLKVLSYTAQNNSLPDSHPQEGTPSLCSFISKEDGRINWQEDTKTIYARLRAYTPWPGVFTLAAGKVLKILEAEPVEFSDSNDYKWGTVVSCNKKDGIIVKTGDSALKLLKLQWQGKNAVSWKDFLNGARNFEGSVLGE